MPRRSSTPSVPKARTQYPNPVGKGVPERARREMYEAFRADWQTMRKVLYDIAVKEEANDSDRIAAAKEYLNRGFGQAPNYEVIEHVIRQVHELDTSVINQLSNAELKTLESAFAKMMQPRDVIDAEILGTTNES
jgi:hypothetical protein